MKNIIFIMYLLIALQSTAQTFVSPPVSPGSCMRDANDPIVAGSREDLKRAVFKYTIHIGSNAYDCTGTLINRNANENNLGQYFITSWHCFHDGSTQADLNNVPITFYFNYQSPPDHLGQVLEPNRSGSIYSMTRKVRLVDHVSDAYGDVAICEILGPPIPPHFNPYFSGWIPVKPAAVNSFVTFGHSSGSLKQVAGTNYVQDGLTLNIQTQSCELVTKLIDALVGWIWKHRWSTSVVCQYVQTPFVDPRYIVYGYTYGNTAEGASGSGIFESNNRWFGNLSGGMDISCSATNDYYGKLYSYYPRQTIKQTFNPQNRFVIDLAGIPGRNKNCYSVIDYNYNDVNMVQYFLFPAKYYQAQNAITLNSNSYVRLGSNSLNQVIVKQGADFTFNAGTFVDLGTYFEVETGATFNANPGVSCSASGTYRMADETSTYEDLAKQELYARINSIDIPDEMELDPALIKQKLSIQVYPNPTSEVVSITLFSVPEETFNIVIYDVLGQQVYSKGFQYTSQKEIAIPVSFLANGVYEISFTSGSNQKNEKLIIQK